MHDDDENSLKERFNVRVSQTLFDRVLYWAKQDGRRPTAWIRRVVEQRINDLERQRQSGEQGQ